MTDWARRNEADRLRRLPLEAVLRSLGAEPDRHDKYKGHTPPDPVGLRRQVMTGAGASVAGRHRSGDPGEKPRFIDAMIGCAEGGGAVPSAPTAMAQGQRGGFPRPIPATSTVSEATCRSAWNRPATIDALIHSGVLLRRPPAPTPSSFCWKRQYPSRAELRGTTGRSWRGMAPGSRKRASSPSRVADPTVVICESAIDASAAGSPSSLPVFIHRRRQTQPCLAPASYRPRFRGFIAASTPTPPAMTWPPP